MKSLKAAVTRIFARLSVLSLLLAQAGCGIGFEVGDDESKEERRENERIFLTPPPSPLKVAAPGDAAEINGIGGDDVSGVTAVFDYTATQDTMLVLDVKSFTHVGCHDDESTEVKLTWRELGPSGETVLETELRRAQRFEARAATSYALVTELKTKHRRCESLGVTFTVSGYPKT